MSTAQIRAELHDLIEQMDERFLKAMHSMASTYQEEDDPIIGYDIDGNPKRASVMQKIYDEEVRAALEEGKYITMEELEKEAEQW